MLAAYDARLGTQEEMARMFGVMQQMLDQPGALMHVRLAMYRALAEGEFTDEQRAGILGGNIARLLGLAT